MCTHRKVGTHPARNCNQCRKKCSVSARMAFRRTKGDWGTAFCIHPPPPPGNLAAIHWKHLCRAMNWSGKTSLGERLGGIWTLSARRCGTPLKKSSALNLMSALPCSFHRPSHCTVPHTSLQNPGTAHPITAQRLQ